MNKKIIILAILLIVIGGIVFSFMLFSKSDNKTENNENVENNNIEEINEFDDEMNDNYRIKLTFNDNEIFVKLNNSKTSIDFLNMLPMELEFEDYNSTEKISYLPEKLTTEDAPSGYTPEIGDFSYYAPWGNLSIFYEDFRYSNSLIKLGEIESGIEKLEELNGNFVMVIERVE